MAVVLRVRVYLLQVFRILETATTGPSNCMAVIELGYLSNRNSGRLAEASSNIASSSRIWDVKNVTVYMG
jgi:hypothetical protein